MRMIGYWVALVGLVGCDDTTPAVTDVPIVLTDIAADAAADVGNPVDVDNPVDVAMTGDVPSGGRVVINEIQAAGDDWVELTNVGGAPVDLGGLVLADSDTSVDGGAPRLTDGLTFPVGTSLAPGQYLLVVADLSDASTGQQMTCLGDGGPTSCYHASFGISALRGERIYLIGAGGAEVAAADYPPNAVAAGRTWGRLPDGTGAFASTAPTPGARNTAP